MNGHPAKTKVIKAGRSRRRFLLFTGNRKHAENDTGEPASVLFTITIIAFAAITICVIVYLFFSGRLP